jgi:aminotransferase
MNPASSHLSHGGPDALGIPPHDFSTNANACGPCPAVLQALRQAPVHTYPDPACTALRQRLGRWHGVDAARIVIGASASELIFRLTAALGMVGQGRQAGAGVPSAHDPLRVRTGPLPAGARPLPPPVVWVPRHAYGDYARAAQAHGLPVRVWDTVRDIPRDATGSGSGSASCSLQLLWATEPSSPLGHTPEGLADAVQWHARQSHARQTAALQSVPGDSPPLWVLDRAYAPLRLSGTEPFASTALDAVWQLFSPNKALGMTGVRGAWLVAPAACLNDAGSLQAELLGHLQALAPSWPLGAHGEVMLMAWPEPAVQQWLARSLDTLRDWKAQLEEGLRRRDWTVLPSVSTFCCARPPRSTLEAALSVMRPSDMPTPANQVSDTPGPSTPSRHTVRDAHSPGEGTQLALLAVLRQQGIKLRDATSFGLPGWFRLGVRPPESQQALWRALEG